MVLGWFFSQPTNRWVNKGSPFERLKSRYGTPVAGTKKSESALLLSIEKKSCAFGRGLEIFTRELKPVAPSPESPRVFRIVARCVTLESKLRIEPLKEGNGNDKGKLGERLNRQISGCIMRVINDKYWSKNWWSHWFGISAGKPSLLFVVHLCSRLFRVSLSGLACFCQ